MREIPGRDLREELEEEIEMAAVVAPKTVAISISNFDERKLRRGRRNQYKMASGTWVERNEVSEDSDEDHDDGERDQNPVSDRRV